MPTSLGWRRAPEQRPAADADDAATGVRAAIADAIVEAVDVAVVACDADERLIYFNPAARRFHGVDADAGIGSSRWAQAFDLYAEDGRTPLATGDIPLVQALRTGSVYGRLFCIVPVGSPPRMVRCDAKQMRDADGRVVGAVALMTDVSEARQATEDLLAERDVARSIIRASADAYSRVDRFRRVVDWNPAAENLLGWTTQEAIGRDVLELLMPARLLGEYAENLGAFLAGGRGVGDSITIDSRFRHRDGHEVKVALTVWPSPHQDGGFQTFARPR